MTAGWNATAPSTHAWKPKLGASPAAEQDVAAGGHDRRVVRLSDGRTALGSVALRVFPNSRRIRAYLRWSDRGQTREQYLGEVTGETRGENLRSAWDLAREKELIVSGQDHPHASQKTPQASSVDVRAVMQGNRNKDTKPELYLRSQLHCLGLRYRVSIRPIPSLRRTADVVFTKARIAVFVDGCYWHGCPQHYRPATRNSGFWSEKISKNRQRDADANRTLEEAGWRVIRVWEHEDPAEAAQRIAVAVREARTTSKQRQSRGGKIGPSCTATRG
jgi:DNA mismatch endonuclease (patch repair protein)